LTGRADLSAEMVAGIDRFLQRETDRALLQREKHWTRDFSSTAAYETSVQSKRDRLRKIIGAVNSRLPTTNSSDLVKVAETDSFTVHEARWPVLEGVFGEGLLLRPKQAPTAVILCL